MAKRRRIASRPDENRGVSVGHSSFPKRRGKPAEERFGETRIRRPGQKGPIAHYCMQQDAIILGNIQSSAVPSEALTRICCWKRICQVRGRFAKLVSGEAWAELCTQRGYVLARKNPRGL